MTLAAENLTLTRGGQTVLREVSCALAPGHITAIVGPNGAGKSSLLMALGGLLAAGEGQVTLDGARLSDLSPQTRARALGYLPQHGEIAWDVSVAALVALGRMAHGDKRREPVHAALAALELEPLRTRPVSQLSGGERARVLLARVLAGEPRWILADEPLAALDLAHQLTLIDHLKDSAKDGAGVVIVLHDLAVAMNHADRVLVLQAQGRGGRLVADGPPQEALSPERIAAVWGAQVQWLGEPGRYALAAQRR